MCYSTNHLSKVILRADFLQLQNELLTNCDAFTAAIRTNFPHVTSLPLMAMSVEVMQEGEANVSRTDSGTQWTYRKEIDGTIAVVVSPNFVSLEYGPADYTTFDAFLADFEMAFNAFRGLFNIEQVVRVGLRYINEIRLPGRAMDWDGIIDQSLIAAVKASLLPTGRMVRSIHQIVQQVGEDQVLLTYGLPNPDFPSPNVQRFFILDIDCYRSYTIESNTVVACAKELNVNATEAFEASIDTGLRDKMGIVVNE